MKNKGITLIALVLMILAQLIIPFKMINDKSATLREGYPYKFKVKPIDPIDPLRGKYITLNYETSDFYTTKNDHWMYKEKAYVTLKADKNGFATLHDISRIKPATDNYFIAQIAYAYEYKPDSIIISIKYPFDRYYMAEHKAFEAELLIRGDRTKEVYSIVVIKDGDAVLSDVCIDGKSIKTLTGGH